MQQLHEFLNDLCYSQLHEFLLDWICLCNYISFYVFHLVLMVNPYSSFRPISVYWYSLLFWTSCADIQGSTKLAYENQRTSCGWSDDSSTSCGWRIHQSGGRCKVLASASFWHAYSTFLVLFCEWQLYYLRRVLLLMFRVLLRTKYRRLPVVDDDGRLVRTWNSFA